MEVATLRITDKGRKAFDREDFMTKEQAIEACAKALLRSKGHREENWEITPWAKEFAEKLVPCLEELDLLPKTTPE
jgi:hypothetical protein